MRVFPFVFLSKGIPIIATAAALSTACAAPEADNRAAPSAPLPDGLYVVWHTARGEITAELFFELVPLTVANFVGLAEGTIPAQGQPAGKRFYDGLKFHRVERGFVVQGGDPLGTGQGDTGYMFADEFTPRLKHDTAGALAMANSGPNTNSCQFYLTLAPVNRLNYKHTVFGRVVRGLEVLPRIVKGDVMERVEIVRVGAKAETFRPDAALFARLRETTRVIAPRDPAQPPLFINFASVDIPAWLPEWTELKLHNYHAVTGVTLRVRTLFRLDGPPPGTEPTGFDPMSAFHRKLAGDDPLSATLVFNVIEKRWHLALGPGLTPRTGLGSDAAGAGSAPQRFKEWEEAVLDAAHIQVESGKPRRSVDAAITGVIEALDRAEPASAR